MLIHMLNISLKVDSQNGELSQVDFWRDWCAFGNSTFDLEIQTSSFADSPRVKIIVEMLTWMLMDKVECWTVTLKVDVQSLNDCDTKYKVEEWDVMLMFAKLIVALSSRMLWSTLIFGGDGTPYGRSSLTRSVREETTGAVFSCADWLRSIFYC